MLPNLIDNDSPVKSINESPNEKLRLTNISDSRESFRNFMKGSFNNAENIEQYGFEQYQLGKQKLEEMKRQME